MKDNTRQLTKKFCTENNLLFLAKTENEAMQIQKNLLALGFLWKDGKGERSVRDSMLSYGFILENCEMMTLEKPAHLYSDVRNYLVCTLEQFDPRYESPELTRDEQISLMKKFDELTRMFTALSAKVDAIYDEVKPKTLDKGSFKIPRK